MKVCKFCGTVCADMAVSCPSCGANEFRQRCDNCGSVFENAGFCPKCGVKVGSRAKICPDCGATYYSAACPDCGYCVGRTRQQPVTQVIYQTQQVAVPSGKRCSKWVAFFLCFFLGYLGAHKFYEGKNGMGILYLFTIGLFGIGWLIDTFSLLFKPDPYYV